MPFPGVPISNEATRKNLPCARGGVTADLPRGGDGGLVVQFPCPNRSVCLHRRGRPPGRPGGTSKTQHMLWANSQPPRCESVKGFHACTNIAVRIPDSRSAVKRERPSAPVCRRAMLGATPLSGERARAAEGGSPYGGDGTRRSSPPGCPDPTLRRGRDPSLRSG